MMGESPTRPKCLLVSPPVEVAAVRSPYWSRAMAPVVPLGFEVPLGGAECLSASMAFSRLLRLLRHEGDALLLGELLRAFADQQDVFCAIHHQAREIDRISDVAHRGDGPSLAVLAVHDRGVELREPVMIEHRSATGIECP